MGLEVVADMGGMWQEATQNVASGIAGLGADSMADTIQKAADALDIFAGLAQVGAVAATLIVGDTVKETVEAAAKTAVMAANPLTWPNVAIALGAAAVAGAVVYGVTRSVTVKSDLSTPSGITAMGQTVGASL